ncbi:hypothetical protein CV691_05525, partial [Borreliella burgdorferi]
KRKIYKCRLYKITWIRKTGKIISYKPSKNIKTFKKYEGKSINLHPPKRKNLKIFYNTKLLKSNNPNKYFLKCNLLKLVKML